MKQDFKTFHDLSTDEILTKINFVHCAIVWYNTCWESIYAADCNKLWIIYDRDFFSFSFLFSIKAYCRKLSTHSCSFIKIQFLRPSASYATKEFRHFWRSIFIFINLFMSLCTIFTYVILGRYHDNLGWKYCLLF